MEDVAGEIGRGRMKRREIVGVLGDKKMIKTSEKVYKTVVTMYDYLSVGY